MKIYFITLSLLVLLTACNRVATKEENIAELLKKIPAMRCEELAQESLYQKQILDGLVARQNHEVTVGDIPATALMLGVNVAMNQSNRSDRDDRIVEMKEKIALLDAETKRKCDL